MHCRMFGSDPGFSTLDAGSVQAPLPSFGRQKCLQVLPPFCRAPLALACSLMGLQPSPPPFLPPPGPAPSTSTLHSGLQGPSAFGPSPPHTHFSTSHPSCSCLGSSSGRGSLFHVSARASCRAAPPCPDTPAPDSCSV